MKASSPAGVAGAIALVVVALIGALVLGRALEARRAGPAAATSAPAVSVPSATASAPPSPSASPSPSAAIPGVFVDPLGDVRGDIVFAAQIVDDRQWGTHELWAIPLADGARARVVLRYPRSPFTDAWPQRYLSADGRRYAFEADRGDGVHRIAIADLLTGHIEWLSTDESGMHDRQPVWDPAARRIAFSRATGDVGRQADEGVWVVNVDGTGLRQLAPGGRGPTYVYHWTPYGRAVAVAQNTGYDLIDADTGARTSMENVVSGDASWRAAEPSLVAGGWETAADGEIQYIFTAESADGPRTVLVRGSSAAEFVTNPRWRPGADEILYMRSLEGRRELRVRTVSGHERTLVERDMFAPAWSPDGSSVVYIHAEEVVGPSPSPCRTPERGGFPCPVGPTTHLVTTELRIVDADGRDDRSLFRLPSAGDTYTPGWCVCIDGLVTRHY